MISEKFLQKLDKTKFYCYYCAEEGIIQEIKHNENGYILELCPKHFNKRSNFYSIYFNKNLQKWCKKRCNSNEIFELITLEKDQRRELNSRYTYINISDIPNNIDIIENNIDGLFYISNLLDKNYITIHKTKYIIKRVDLIRKCNNIECNKEFKIKDIYRIEESTCCSNKCYNNIININRKESIENGDNLSEDFLNKLNKNNFYCYYCARLGIIEKLNLNQEDTIKNNIKVFMPCNKHRGANYLMLGYLKDVDSNNYNWYIIHGVKENGQRNKIKTLEEKQQYILNNSFTNIKIKDIKNKFNLQFIDINDNNKINNILNNYNIDKNKLKNYYISNLLNEEWINTIENEYAIKQVYIFGKCMNDNCNSLVFYDLNFNKTNLCDNCKNNYGNYLHQCEACGQNFPSKGTVKNNCKKCEKELNNILNNNKLNKINKNNISLWNKLNIIKIIKYKDNNLKEIEVRIVNINNFYFIYKLCPGCNKYFKIINYISKNKFDKNINNNCNNDNSNNSYKNNIFENLINKDNNCFCSDICRSKYNQLSGFCSNKNCCKWSEIRDSTGLCMECRSNISQNMWKMKYCDICQENTPHNGSSCLICNPNSKGGIQEKYLIIEDNVRIWRGNIAKELVFNLLNGLESFDNYPELENRKGHICYNKHDILTDDPIYFTNYLTEEDNICWWKNERADELVKDLLSGKKNIKDYPQLEIRNNHVCYLRKDILTDESILIKKSYLTIENGIRYWKNENAKQLVEDLLKGNKNIKNYPELENRFNHICYKRKDILTDQLYKFTGETITIVDNIEFIYNKETKEVIEKDKYFNEIENNLNKNNIIKNDIIQKLINEEGFNIEPISKLNNDTWSKKLTNEYLVEKDYKYICYIKNVNNQPFIVGKTGTTLVNESEVDFDFIVGDSNDSTRTGLGRQFLRERFPEIKYMDFDYVLCKNFETEKEALNFEKYIAKKFNLFQS